MTSSQLHLLPMQLRHIDSCAMLIDRLPLFAQYNFNAESARRLITRALEEGRSDLCVVEEGELLVGFAWFVPRGAFDRSGYLRIIAVDDRLQGRGIGQKLLEHLEKKHLQNGGIVLLSTDTNTSAHHFYERLGYQQVGLLPDYVKPGLSERIYYKKPL